MVVWDVLLSCLENGFQYRKTTDTIPNRMAYHNTTHSDNYDDGLSQTHEEMEDMTYDEKVAYAMLKVKNGMKGFQDAMVSLEVIMALQQERIEELESTVKIETRREASLHTAMFLVCVLCYVYGSFFGLYMCRK